MSDKRRVLFVDDEPNILSSLRRTLMPVVDEWEMSFVDNGLSALELLSKQPYDVIVSDLSMPGMDGFQLLSRVKQRYPQMIRIAFSGQINNNYQLDRLKPVHQYLSKPVESETIIQTVNRACSLHDILHDPNLRKLVTRLESLPSLPHVYDRLVAELNLPSAELKRIANIISEDQVMSLKVLQFVNSAFFGLPRKISNLHLTVSMLGLDIITSLALTAHVFQQIEDKKLSRFPLQKLWNHSTRTSVIAKKIAILKRQDKEFQDNAFSAGLLHDIGKLVLIDNMPEQYLKAMSRAKLSQPPVHAAEREIFNTTHAEVGAYLLGVWGLNEPIVEAVAFHHVPARATSPKTNVTLMVSIASHIDNRDHSQDIDVMLRKYNIDQLTKQVLMEDGEEVEEA